MVLLLHHLLPWDLASPNMFPILPGDHASGLGLNFLCCRVELEPRTHPRPPAANFGSHVFLDDFQHTVHDDHAEGALVIAASLSGLFLDGIMQSIHHHLRVHGRQGLGDGLALLLPRGIV